MKYIINFKNKKYITKWYLDISHGEFKTFCNHLSKYQINK